MGADQEQANINLSSTDKEKTLSLNPKFIIGSAAAVLAVGAIAALSFQAGKSVNSSAGSDKPQEESDLKLLKEEKLKLEAQVQRIEQERQELEQRASTEHAQFEEVKKNLEEQVKNIEQEREELDQRANAERNQEQKQFEEAKKKLEEQVKQLGSELNALKKQGNHGTGQSEQGNKAPVNDEALAKKWTSLRDRKYSELEPELKEFALKNKSTAPPEMKAYLENLELTEFSDTFIEKLLRVKEVIDKPEFELHNEKKQSLRNVMKTCQKQGLLPMTDEERYGPIKEFLNKSSNLNKAALEENEEANESFCALGKIKEEDRSTILGSNVTKYNELLKNYLTEVFNLIDTSPELLYFFKKDYVIFAQCLNSQDPQIVFQTLRLFNRFIFKDNTLKNKQSVLDLEVIPRVVSLLSGEFKASQLKLDLINSALIFFINISSGNLAQASYVVKAGAVPLIAGYVTHSIAGIRDSANVEFRDLVINNGILSNLLIAVQMEKPESNPVLEIIRGSALTLRNIFAKKLEALSWDKVSPSIPIIKLLLKFKDENALENVTWTLLHLTTHPDMVKSIGTSQEFNACFDDLFRILGSNQTKYNQLLKSYLAEVHILIDKSPELLQFLKKGYNILAFSLNSQDPEIVNQTLKLISRFVVKDCTVQNIQSFIDLKIVPRVVSLLSPDFDANSQIKNGIVIEAVKLFINISAIDRGQAYSIVEAGAVPSLVKFIVHSNATICRYAIWALGNMCFFFAGSASSVEAQTANNEFRDILLNNGLLSNLLQAVQKEPSNPDLQLLRESARILKNLFKENIDSLPWDKISPPSIAILELLLKSKNTEVLEFSTCALSSLAAHPTKDPSKFSCFLEPIDIIQKTTSSNNIKNYCTSFVTNLGNAPSRT